MRNIFSELFGGPRYIPAGRVDFASANLPEYAGCYAKIIDSLFTKPELTAILAAAEAYSPWDVAQINSGIPGHALTNTSYRNGERIIYDSAELSASIFAKVRPHLADIEEIERVEYVEGVKMLQKWRMVRLNERLRFLRYPVGGFFKKHIDGAYENEETGQRTFYTLQFYLPSDASGSHDSFKAAKGGTTRFIGRKGAYADVAANPGRVLVFQHATLLHTGEEVTDGVKCAVRSDVLYEKVGSPVPLKKR
ncbi:P4Hc domain-containing protein [Mycena kentingensis (nom. inval.)]|nr:P4Hc domain-containing protein [Mycena kentingensis (nom. inval.)]